MKLKKNLLAEKSYLFAIRIVKLCKFFDERKEFVLSHQVLRSGTAIGALIRESEYAQSKADFVNKLHIALKEANETEYWLQLLKDTGSINEKIYESLEKDLKEILRLLISSIKTYKTNQKEPI